MKSIAGVRTLFAIASLYDGVFGLAFLFAGPAVFERFGVQPPNHWGYVQFPAALLVVFALMFLAVAVRPFQNRNLIPYGILLKVSYVGTVLWHWNQGGLPGMWKPFAIIDLVFILAFALAYRALVPGKEQLPAA